MSSEVYWSVDIEADGPYPGDYSMSSFGVVACAIQYSDGSIERVSVDHPRMGAYHELKPISKQFVLEAAAVAGFDRSELIANGEDPRWAMSSVASFIEATTASFHRDARPIFVGWPLGFDWLFFYWYLMKFNGSSPFSFSGHIDMKSYYAGAADIMLRKVGKRSMPAGVPSTRKHTHNALDDAREQGEMFYNLLKWNKDRSKE